MATYNNYDWMKFLSHWIILCILFEKFRLGSSQTILRLDPSDTVIVKIPEEDSFSLSCVASNDFAPGLFSELRWSKNGTNLSINDKVTPNAPKNRTDIKVNGTTYTLVISSPELADEGTYKCKLPTAPNAPEKKVTVRIEVTVTAPTEPPPQSLGPGPIAGIVIGSIIGLVLIIVLVYFLVKKSCPPSSDEKDKSRNTKAYSSV